MSASLFDDRDLTREQVQSLSSADAVAAFFAYLHYPDDARLPMTAGALGLSSDLSRAVRHIERLSSVEAGALEIYLFELKSVTVSHTRALARAFRDRAGNYLLVLTDDYDRIDYVLLERVRPDGNGRGIGRRGITLRPRVLTVDRRNPDRVALRVLRRFTLTELDADGEPDAYAQYDKLQSAYTVAEWSEPLFNNRALLSDYYLNHRLPDLPEWDDPERNRAYRAVRGLLARTRREIAGADGMACRQRLIQPLLEILGFRVKVGGGGTDPDLTLFAGPDPDAGAFVLAYRWGRYLDGKDEARDTERPEENPGAQVVSLLEAGVAPWAVVTNGKLWRLYSARAHSRATNYYEIDLEETLATPDPALAFRYFFLLFREAAFAPAERTVGGETRTLSFLDWLVEESATYARELGERLKERVFEDIFPHFAEGFIQGLGGPEALLALAEDERAARLDDVYQGTLTFLYRLLFVLYAESRDLLPAREVRGYHAISLGRLKDELAEQAGPLEDQVPTRLARAYSGTDTGLYERLLGLFRVIDQGDPERNVPIYNGGLFLTQVPSQVPGTSEVPGTWEESAGVRHARFLLETKMPDRYLALGLDRLARDLDLKRGDLAFIDYKSLGVRQLGSIYEGLLEFKVCVAPAKMAVVKGKKTEEIVPYAEARRRKRTILTEGRGAQARPRVLPRGTVYLENDRRERKASGSYYTPDYIVQYIVRHTVGPVLDEKLEALRPRVREAEARFRKAVERKRTVEGVTPDEPALLTDIAGNVLRELFDVKVLDPAMGSGHFLVEAVDYITDGMVRFLDGYPFLGRFFEGMRRDILTEMERQAVSIDPARLTDVTLLKRHVLKRCVYGVDLNRMAVELAKVSLWLDCFTLGAPLSFLDHHLRHGNSLIGATAREAEAQLSSELPLFGGPFAGLLRAAEIMRGISLLTDVTLTEVHQSEQLFREFDRAARPYKQLLDLYVARDFGVRLADEFLRLYGVDAIRAGPESVGPPYDRALREARQLYEEKRFFHWDLEFPEVFIDLERADWKRDAGFDAVIGNPPYDELSQEARGSQIVEIPYFQNTPHFQPALGYRINLYRLFTARALELVRTSGYQSFIVPLSLLADQFTLSLRRHLLANCWVKLIEQFPQKDDPRNRVFPDAKLSTCIFVIAKAPPAERQSYIRVHSGRTIEEDSPFYVAAQLDFQEFDSANLSIPGLGQQAWNLVLRLADDSIFARLGDFVQALPGELMINRQFAPYLTTGRNGEEIIRGSHISMYQVIQPKQGKDLHLDRDKYLAEHSSGAKAFHHRTRRLVYQRYAAIDNYRRLIATILPKGHFCSHTVGYLSNVKDYRLEFLLGLFNSRLLDWRFDLASTNNNINGYELEALPLRRIRFTSSETVRQQHLVELVSQYESGQDTALLAVVESLLPQDVNGNFLALASGATGAEEKSDVVHDLLAHLAGQMIDLNKGKQAEQKRFLDWLEAALQVSPDKQGRTGLDALTGKTKILGYLGDYQKGEPETPWSEVEAVLFRNKRRLGVSLSEARFLARLRAEYEKSLDVLRPIKAQLARTDRLIDQVVYRLYGLTEEEIAVVEGR